MRFEERAFNVVICDTFYCPLLPTTQRKQCEPNVLAEDIGYKDDSVHSVENRQNMTPDPAEGIFFVGDRGDGLTSVPKVFAEWISKLASLILANGTCDQLYVEELLVHQLTAEEFSTRKIQAEDFPIPF